jgi:hypothetical protein
MKLLCLNSFIYLGLPEEEYQALFMKSAKCSWQWTVMKNSAEGGGTGQRSTETVLYAKVDKPIALVTIQETNSSCMLSMANNCIYVIILKIMDGHWQALTATVTVIDPLTGKKTHP